MGVCVAESFLHEVWRSADGDRSRVATADGRSFRILYSGMPGGSFGPDFKDAVLEARDGSEVQGDVEIHREVSDWYTHGHDEDERYGRVIFHAVGSSSHGDKRRATLNALGAEVEEIEIGELVVGSDVSSIALRARFPRERGVTVEDAVEVEDEWLDAAGDERFAQMIASRRVDVDRFGPDLAMQMSVFEGLGYPRNRIQFRTLARRLPWPFLVRFAHRTRHSERGGEDCEEDVDRAADLLRWAGGFAPKPGFSPVPKLAGDPPRWCAAASRPANRPQVRIVSAAHLVAEWWSIGGPLRWALSEMSVADDSARLPKAFRPINGIGEGRAGEIVVNAVLPTIAAWAEIGGDGALYRAATHQYRQHRSLPSNSVLREAERAIRLRGCPIGRIRGARRQQGAMHIYKMMLLRPRVASQIRLGQRVLSS